MNLAEFNLPIIKVPTLLNPTTISELEEQWDQIDLDKTTIVLVVGSAPHFCRGMDIHWIAGQLDDSTMTAARKFGAFLDKLQSAPCITLAVVAGEAVGGGVGICAACNIAIASNDSTFRLTEGLFGLVPGLILPSLLTRIPRQVVAKMVFCSKKYSAPAAVEMGLIDEQVPADQLEAALYSWIGDLKKCKKQSIIDLKELSGNAGHTAEVLLEKAATLLLTRLQDEDIQTRLANLAYFDPSLTNLVVKSKRKS